MRNPRALPLLALVASLSANPALSTETAQPAAADVAQLLKAMQARLTRLEVRNAELERRLAEPVRLPESVEARLEDVETEVLTLSRKPDPLEKFDGVAVGASLIMVAQHAKGGTVSATELSARADVEVELPGGSIGNAEGKIFAHFRAGDGDGVDGAATPPGAFATANATVFGNINSPVLMQAWYQLEIPVGAVSGNLGRVELTAGKIDPFGFFDGNNIADDESEGFMNLAFVHNPLLDAGGDIGVGAHGASPGVRIAYISDVNGGDNITASLGVFGTSNGISAGADYLDTFTKPLTIAQLEYAGKTWPGLAGAYRIYAWNNGRAVDQINALDVNGDPTIEEKHSGWGISLDQQVTAHTTLFARYGDSTKGNLNFDRAYTLGTQINGGAWGRENDRVGLAYGALSTSSEYRNAGNGGVAKSGSEKIYELFYAWQANDSLQITPSLQFIDNPAGNADDLKVWGLRAKLAY
jgi:high affinity Mn2+ porin